MGRDTANAVGFPAAILQKRDPEAVFAIVTADHVIEPVDTFQSCINKGFEVAGKQKNALVTFGIVPNFGHTGLGYIQRGEAISGIAGAFQGAGLQRKTRQSDRRPIRRVRPILLEQRDVRVARATRC